MNYYYPYRNNMYQNNRLYGGGFIAPLLIGGIAGYAIGNNGWGNKKYNCCSYYPYYYPYYYNYNLKYPVNYINEYNLYK